MMGHRGLQVEGMLEGVEEVTEIFSVRSSGMVFIPAKKV